MREVQKYEPSESLAGVMCKNGEGNWVDASDYDALAAECERMRADNESLAKNLRGKHALTGSTYEHLIAQRDAALAELAALKGGREAVAWYTDDHLTDRSATTYDKAVAARWKSKGWSVFELFAAPPAQASAWVAVSERMPEHNQWVVIAWRDQFKVGRFDSKHPFSPAIVDRTAGKYWNFNTWQPIAAPTPGASDGKEEA